MICGARSTMRTSTRAGRGGPDSDRNSRTAPSRRQNGQASGSPGVSAAVGRDRRVARRARQRPDAQDAARDAPLLLRPRVARDGLGPQRLGAVDAALEAHPSEDRRAVRRLA